MTPNEQADILTSKTMFTTTSRYVKRLDVINMQVLTKYYSSAYSLKQNWSSIRAYYGF